jgi:uncharacterized membrane protein
VSANRDLRGCAAAAVVLAALALVVPIEWLSLLLLAPLAFFLSGYSILAAAFVRRPPEAPQAFFAAVGLSLAVLAILPLPLNYLGGLTPGTWALALVLVVLLGCGVAELRRGLGWNGPAEVAWRPRASASAGLLGLGGLLAAVAALVLAFVPLSATHAEGFTELWLRPVQTAGGAAVRVGVGSEEKQATDYLLRVQFRGGGEPIVRPLTLEPGETTVLPVFASPQPVPARPGFVTATLFRRDQPARAYRRVYAWIRASDPG